MYMYIYIYVYTFVIRLCEYFLCLSSVSCLSLDGSGLYLIKGIDIVMTAKYDNAPDLLGLADFLQLVCNWRFSNGVPKKRMILNMRNAKPDHICLDLVGAYPILGNSGLSGCYPQNCYFKSGNILFTGRHRINLLGYESSFANLGRHSHSDSKTATACGSTH